MASQETEEKPREIAVIGAGIVGMCCARWLQRDGHRVTVYDPVAPGESCSFGNAGILAYASVLPLSTPGMMRKVPGWLADPLGPLTIRWRYLPRIAPWLVRLVAAGRESRVGPIADALRALNAPSLDAYRDLFDAEDFAGLVRHDGVIYVYASAASFEAAAWGWDQRRRRGVRAERLGYDELHQLEPALSPAFHHAMYLEDSAHVLNPHRTVTILAERFQAGGGTIVAQRVRDAEARGNGSVTLHTESGSREADAVVVAAGAWSRGLAARLGSPVPLEAERGYHVTVPNPGVDLRRPVAEADGGFIATPMEMGLRIAGTVELGGLNAPPNYARARVLLKHGERLFPGLDGGGASEWTGYRPSLPDSLPVIGRSPRFDNVYFAFGHGHLGLTEGAITAKLIADQIAGRETVFDPAPYRADRF